MNRFIGTKSPKVWLSGLAFVLNCGTSLAEQKQDLAIKVNKSIIPTTADD